VDAACASSPNTSSMPIGSARVFSTSTVCGCTPFDTKNTFDFDLAERLARVMASAAAVPSSSSEALAISMPVRSAHICWKLISASMRPCEISAWYGV
jgi:hypothetical protein